MYGEKYNGSIIFFQINYCNALILLYILEQVLSPCLCHRSCQPVIIALRHTIAGLYIFSIKN